MKRIGIIGAFDPEVEKYIELLSLKKIDTKREIYFGIVDQKEVYVAKSGVGKVNASSMTQYLIDQYSLDGVINSGCAGSLDTNVKLLDIVLPTYVTYHDFLPVRIMKAYTPNEACLKPDPYLCETMKKVLKNHPEYTVHEGVIVSGDCFVTDANHRDQIKEQTQALAVDMESAPIAHVCALNEVPCFIIRTISDFSDGVENFEEEASYQSSLLVIEWIKSL